MLALTSILFYLYHKSIAVTTSPPGSIFHPIPNDYFFHALSFHKIFTRKYKIKVNAVSTISLQLTCRLFLKTTTGCKWTLLK